MVLVLAVWTWQRNEVWGDEASLWDDAIRKSPEKGRAYYNRGTVYHNEYADMETAMLYYIDCLRREPNLAVAYSSLANNLRVLGDAEGAEACALTAVRLEPGEAMHWYILGRVYMMRRKFDLARGFLEKAVSIDPAMIEARFANGLCLEESEEWAQAAQVFTDLLSWDPNEIRGHYHLGLCFSRLGQAKDAELEYGWTIETNPLFPDGHLGLGDVYAATGHYDLAVLHFKQAVRLSEGDKDTRKHFLKGLSGLAFSLHSLSRLARDPKLIDRAATVYERLLKENPESVEARVDLALIEGRDRGNRPRAEALLAECDALSVSEVQREAVRHAREVLAERKPQ